MCQRALQSVVLGGLSGATAQLQRARTGPELGPLEEKTTRFFSSLGASDQWDGSSEVLKLLV